MEKAEGHIQVNILKDSDNLLQKFEDAFRFTMEKYVDPTPIKYFGAEFRQDYPGRIDIIYSFERELEFQYNISENNRRETTKNSGEFCYVLFEVWTKLLIQNLFEGELEVETKHVAIKFFETFNGTEKVL